MLYEVKKSEYFVLNRDHTVILCKLEYYFFFKFKRIKNNIYCELRCNDVYIEYSTVIIWDHGKLFNQFFDPLHKKILRTPLTIDR